MKIDEIILFTTNLRAQKKFYSETLNFGILEDTQDKVTFMTGKSRLTFQRNKKSYPSHLAFNIPFNRIKEALLWLQDRVDVFLFEGQPIIDFSNWNAEAIYFYDNDRNILEFIARRNLNVKSDTEFTSESIISISEMAIATTDIEMIYNVIQSMKPIPIFDGDFDKFCALGNEEGLFIIIDKSKKKWFPTEDKAFTSNFIIRGDYNFKFVDGKITELS